MKLQINKAASTTKAAIAEADMALINAQALRELTSEEVFTFKVNACNDQVDRDFERFAPATLTGLAKLFVGKTVIFDHRWSASNQTARAYKTAVKQQADGSYVLTAECYMLRNDSTKDLIAAIEGGILREVSVGCAIGKAVCSICGEEYGTCAHHKGAVYEGQLCVCELHDPVDAYELSFVAVPAQPNAGITKETQEKGWTTAEMTAAKIQLEIENEKWRYV